MGWDAIKITTPHSIKDFIDKHIDKIISKLDDLDNRKFYFNISYGGI